MKNLSLIIKIFFVCVFIILGFEGNTQAQEKYNGELIIRLKNPWEDHQITVEAVSNTIWERSSLYFPVVKKYSYYSKKTHAYDFDFVNSINGDLDIIGYAKYKITVTKSGNNYSLYIDYRDCNYNNDGVAVITPVIYMFISITQIINFIEIQV